jgi:hypothetical protein
MPSRSTSGRSKRLRRVGLTINFDCMDCLPTEGDANAMDSRVRNIVQNQYVISPYSCRFSPEVRARTARFLGVSAPHSRAENVRPGRNGGDGRNLSHIQNP